MGRAWNTNRLFALLIAGFWIEGNAAGVNMEELYASLERRLRENLLTRIRLA